MEDFGIQAHEEGKAEMTRMEIHDDRERRVLIIGDGMLGLELKDVFKSDKRWNGLVLGHKNMPIEDSTKMMGEFVGLLGKHHFDVVINTASFTNVDGCEREPGKALLVNALGAKNVARACRFAMVPILMHISTDYVFSRDSMYDLIDEGCFSYNPANQYGVSKAAGEMSVKTEYDENEMINATIIRTSRLFGKYRRNFVDFISESCMDGDNGGKPIGLSNLNFTIPTSARYLAERIHEMCNERFFIPGAHVKHIVNSASYVPSLYGYAYEIYEQMQKLGLNAKCTFAKIDGPDPCVLARRPRASVLLRSPTMEKNSDWTLYLNRYLREKFNVRG